MRHPRCLTSSAAILYSNTPKNNSCDKTPYTLLSYPAKWSTPGRPTHRDNLDIARTDPAIFQRVKHGFICVQSLD